MMTLTEYIARECAGQSQTEIAHRLGISQSFLSEILAERRRPGDATKMKIERATGGLVPAAVWFQSAAPPPASGSGGAQTTPTS